MRSTPLAVTVDMTQRAIFYQWLHLALTQLFHTLSPAAQEEVCERRERARRR